MVVRWTCFVLWWLWWIDASRAFFFSFFNCLLVVFLTCCDGLRCSKRIDSDWCGIFIGVKRLGTYRLNIKTCFYKTFIHWTVVCG